MSKFTDRLRECARWPDGSRWPDEEIIQAADLLDEIHSELRYVDALMDAEGMGKRAVMRLPISIILAKLDALQ